MRQKLPILISKSNSLHQQSIIKNYINRFIGSLDTKEVTKKEYFKSLNRFEQWVIENQVYSPQHEDILRYKTGLLDSGLTAFTISAYLVALRRFFGYLEAIKAYPNVAREVKGMRRPHGFFRDTLTLTQIRRLLDIIPRQSVTNLRDYAIINLILRTGIRTIEAIRANVEDVTVSGNDTILKVFGKGRDSKDEFVVLTQTAYDPLMDYLKVRGKPKGQEPLFVSHSNRDQSQRLTTRSIRRIVQHWMEVSGFKTDKLTAHSLRHTAATVALQNGADVVQVKEMLRHANINTTMIYVHNVNRLKNAAEKAISF